MHCVLNECRICTVCARLLICCLCMAAGCVPESGNAIKNKLEVICEDDLRSVMEELPAGSIADSVYYDIRIFNKYREGKFSYRAEVDYYCLKNVHVKMVRKYRYHASFRKWERYFNQYQFVHD